MVLDRSEIPLDTNGSENDIRCYVTRRKLSGGTRSDLGRDCRDAFLGLAKTCAKLKISFWDYLADRLIVPGAQIIPHLPKSSSPEPNCPDRHHFCPSYPLEAAIPTGGQRLFRKTAAFIRSSRRFLVPQTCYRRRGGLA